MSAPIIYVQDGRRAPGIQSIPAMTMPREGGPRFNATVSAAQQYRAAHKVHAKLPREICPLCGRQFGGAGIGSHRAACERKSR